jgi:hypothetical protein
MELPNRGIYLEGLRIATITFIPPEQKSGNLLVSQLRRS